MKKLIQAILKSGVGKAVLSLILKRFLDLLKDRAAATHGSLGVELVSFLNRFEDTLIPDFLETHDPETVHAELVDNGVKDDTKKKGFLSGILGSGDDDDDEKTA